MDMSLDNTVLELIAEFNHSTLKCVQRTVRHFVASPQYDRARLIDGCRSAGRVSETFGSEDTTAWSFAWVLLEALVPSTTDGYDEIVEFTVAQYKRLLCKRMIDASMSQEACEGVKRMLSLLSSSKRRMSAKDIHEVISPMMSNCDCVDFSKLVQ